MEGHLADVDRRRVEFRGRVLRRAFIVLVVALLAAGCPAVEEPDEPVELVFSFGPDESGSLDNLIDAFNAEHEGEIQVRWRVMSDISDEYFRQLRSDFEAGVDDIDVLGGDVIWTAEFGDNGWIADLSTRFHRDYDPDDFVDAAMNSTAFRNRIWAVPWFTDAGLLYYRQDLLEDAGFDDPPETWNELADMAEQVTEEAEVEYGFVFQGAEYEGGVTNALEYIWSANGRVLEGNISIAGQPGQNVVDPNIIQVDDPRSAQGLDIARGLVERGVAPEEVAEFDEQDAWERFLAGDAVFMRNWPFVFGLIATGEYEVGLDQVGFAELPVDTAPEPVSTLGGWNLMINAASPNEDAAWEFIRFATDAEQQRQRAIEGGFLPSLIDLYEDPDIADEAPIVAVGEQVVDNARVRPISPYYSQMSPRIARAFTQTLRGDITGQEAVSQLETELRTILRRN
jgi:multiple sugar transport system substrate-binding protein